MAGHLLLIFGSLQKLLLQFLEVLSKSSWTDHPILIWKLVGRSRILKSSDSLVADPPNAQTALLKLSQPERKNDYQVNLLDEAGETSLCTIREELEVVVKVLRLLLLLPLLQELLHQVGARVAMVVKAIQSRG